jgi:hypothetical protein
MGLAARSEFGATGRYRGHLVPANPPRRCLSARPRGVPNRPSRAKCLISPTHLSSSSAALLGSSTDDASRGLSAPTPSLGFRPLWHMRHTRSGQHGLCLPATFRPQGLATLSTACSLARLAGLISCRQRLWGSPFGAFALPEVFSALPPTLAPRAVTADLASTNQGLTEARGLRTGFRVLPRASPLRAAQVFSPSRRRMLPWVFSLSGFVGHQPWQALRPASSHALACRRSYL